MKRTASQPTRPGAEHMQSGMMFSFVVNRAS
jgi:hypothetical protein